MNHEERLEQILKLVETRQSVSICDLRERLFVSDATIRRDLSELSRRGLILKSHGGAVATTKVRNTTFSQENIPSSPIADAAAQLIENNSIIFVSGGSYTHAMISGIAKHSGLTVLTDSTVLASALENLVDHLWCTGGKYIPAKKVFGGTLAAEFASALRFDRAFFSCSGIAYDNCVTYDEQERILLLQTVLPLSSSNVLLCSRNDFSTAAHFNVCTLDDMDVLVTDSPELAEHRFHKLIIPA